MTNKVKPITIIFAAAVLAMFAAVPALAQSPITATVDRTGLTTDDALTLTVSVSGDGQPLLPSLSGFNLLSSGTSSQISIINGAMSSQVIYTYILQPAQPGPLTIEPITLQQNGQSYTTAPITVQVSPGTGRPSAAPQMPQMPGMPPSLQQFFNNSGFGGLDPFNSFGGDPFGQTGSGDPGFVEAGVSNASPYVGEQVVYTFRYYQPADDFFGALDQPQFVPPAFSGFWSEGDSQQRQYQAQDGSGRPYNVTELNTVLIPTKTGELTIEPGRLVTPGGFFSQGAELTADPVTVTVQPLPGGAPAGFNGAVGQFDISAGVDTAATTVNEPVTWQVTLNGRGNIKTLADPQWPDLPNWRSFESAATVNSQVVDGQLAGSRHYERLLVPQAAGDFTIPALEFSFFNPATGQYQTISTEPIPVTVAPGAGANSPQAAAAALPAPSDAAAGTLTTGSALPLKPVGSLQRATAPLVESPLYWLAWLVPLLGLVGNFAWQRRQNFRAGNPELVRSSNAAKQARQSLANARREQGDELYRQAGQLLTTYLADKLNRPVLGLTLAGRTELLRQHGLSVELIDRVNQCLSAAEQGSYSPGAAGPAHAQNLLTEIDRLIRDLDSALK
ncbi:MAG: BatD family protein [Anaerolineae bacterium]